MTNNTSQIELEERIATLTAENNRLKEQLQNPVGDEVNSPIPTPPDTKNTPTLQLVIDSIPQAIFWKDLNFRYLGCNITFANRAGLKCSKDIVSLTDFDLPWKTAEAESFRRYDQKIMDTGLAEYNIIESQRDSMDNQTWINTNKIPLHDDAGKVIGILGTFEDISSRTQAEESLKHYETITATIDDLVAIVDTNHIYKAVNEAHYHAYGVKREEILGKNIEELIDIKLYKELVEEKINQALQGKTISYQTWREFPKWGKRFIEAKYFPIFSEDGKDVVGVVSKIRDTTQNKQLEVQLQQSQKMEAVGRLAGGIAHDFNNILSVINGYSDLCLLRMEKDHSCLAHIEMIKESGLRAARLTQQLLAFSRRQIIKPKIMCLADQLTAIHNMLARLLGEHIDIELTQKKSTWDVKLDQAQFEQIVINLAINARDAMPEGGKLTIELANFTSDENNNEIRFNNTLPAGDYVAMAISDNGTGISGDIQEKIYEPFFTTKDKNKGTGLGLSTVYGIIKQNNGYISLYSEVGKGTTFKLYFPRCTEGKYEKTPNNNNHSDKVETGLETILLIEDEKALRQLCVEILTELGYTVLEASNGKEAIETANRFHGQIDLLLTDVVMPILNGPETAKVITTQHPDIAIIFMSGYTENSIVHHGVLDDGITFIHKPISRNGLATSVRKAIDQQKTNNGAQSIVATKSIPATK
ncbi:hybrid sensor histidine kinase/response regulator [Desulforhopalus sp. 52FAK]